MGRRKCGRFDDVVASLRDEIVCGAVPYVNHDDFTMWFVKIKDQCGEDHTRT